MHANKRKKLEAAGYKVGDAADFLGLSPEEAALIDVKVNLAAQLAALRKKMKVSQVALAKRIGSSQSRVAKMEACDPSVSMDLMFKSAFALGADQKMISRFFTATTVEKTVATKRARAKKRAAPKKPKMKAVAAAAKKKVSVKKAATKRKSPIPRKLATA
jgi:transcriptional regulator with XRE-family HTH domain